MADPPAQLNQQFDEPGIGNEVVVAPVVGQEIDVAGLQLTFHKVMLLNLVAPVNTISSSIHRTILNFGSCLTKFMHTNIGGILEF
jgi:hypothetical protein